MANKRRPANTEREWWALLKSKDDSFIRSKKEWLAVIKDQKQNPLDGCSFEAIKHFTDSLKFKNGGLGHADYSEVAKELNYFQFRRLWARFGLSMGLFEDHEGYKCTGPGSCETTANAICTSNC